MRTHFLSLAASDAPLPCELARRDVSFWASAPSATSAASARPRPPLLIPSHPPLLSLSDFHSVYHLQHRTQSRFTSHSTSQSSALWIFPWDEIQMLAYVTFFCIMRHPYFYFYLFISIPLSGCSDQIHPVTVCLSVWTLSCLHTQLLASLRGGKK